MNIHEQARLDVAKHLGLSGKPFYVGSTDEIDIHKLYEYAVNQRELLLLSIEAFRKITDTGVGMTAHVNRVTRVLHPSLFVDKLDQHEEAQDKARSEVEDSLCKARCGRNGNPPHRGKVIAVRVENFYGHVWEDSYCETAIERRRSAGFKVTPLEEAQDAARKEEKVAVVCESCCVTDDYPPHRGDIYRVKLSIPGKNNQTASLCESAMEVAIANGFTITPLK